MNVITSRGIAADLAALFACAILAAIPYGYMMAAEDGLPGDIERIVANSVAASLGFAAVGGALLVWKRKNPKRLKYAIIVVAIMALMALTTTVRRAGG